MVNKPKKYIFIRRETQARGIKPKPKIDILNIFFDESDACGATDSLGLIEGPRQRVDAAAVRV